MSSMGLKTHLKFAPMGRPSPDQHGAILIAGQSLGLDDLDLEVLKVGVVEVKTSLQRPIRYPSLALQQVEHLGKYLIECHTLYSTGSQGVISGWPGQSSLDDGRSTTGQQRPGRRFTRILL